MSIDRLVARLAEICKLVDSHVDAVSSNNDACGMEQLQQVGTANTSLHDYIANTTRQNELSIIQAFTKEIT